MEILHVEKTSFVEFGDEVATVLPVITVIPDPPVYGADSNLDLYVTGVDANNIFLTANLSAKLSGSLTANCLITQRTNKAGGGYDIRTWAMSFTIPPDTLVFSQNLAHNFGLYIPGGTFYSIGVYAPLIPGDVIVGTTVHYSHI